MADRDTSKRVIMGRISKKNSDQIIITNDNPRFENPENIANQILFGTKKDKVILDRADAIEYALKYSQPSDVIVVAGKGTNNIRSCWKKINFSDIKTINELS